MIYVGDGPSSHVSVGVINQTPEESMVMISHCETHLERDPITLLLTSREPLSFRPDSVAHSWSSVTCVAVVGQCEGTYYVCPITGPLPWNTPGIDDL